MSSTADSPSSASTAIPSAYTGSGTTGGVSSSLYLFTFLITIVVLALISGSLLFRAYYVRRQFQRRVEEAIRSGRPLPDDAAAALGIGGRGGGRLNNRKKEKKHGPMPGMWEAEMWRDGEKWDLGSAERGDRGSVDEWDEITPLCLTHEAPPPPPPEPVDPASLLPEKRGPWILRPFLTPRMPDLAAYVAQHPSTGRPGLSRTLTGISLPPVKPVWTVPEDGEEVTLGVLIAMPVEGKNAERWEVDQDEEESEVPEVCLGVMNSVMRH